MNKLLFALFISFLFSYETNAAPFKGVAKFYVANHSSAVLTDLIENNKFTPPYKEIGDIRKLAKLCKEEIYDTDKQLEEFQKLAAKQEYLSVAAHIDPEKGILTTFIKNSGGMSVLYDYVDGSFYQLVNLPPYQRQQALILFKAFSNSATLKKLNDYMLGDNSKYRTAMLYLCGQIDMKYTALGGRKYSVSYKTLLNTLDLIKNSH